QHTGKRVELPRRCHHVGIRTGKNFRHQPEPGDQPATVSYFPFEAAAALSMTRLTSVPLPVPRSCAAEPRLAAISRYPILPRIPKVLPGTLAAERVRRPLSPRLP